MASLNSHSRPSETRWRSMPTANASGRRIPDDPSGSFTIGTLRGRSIFQNVEIMILDEPVASTDSKVLVPPERKPASAQRYPADAIEHQGTRYKVFAERLGWHAAEARSEELGGRLAVVKSGEQN